MENYTKDQKKSNEMNEGKISESTNAEGLNSESQMTDKCSGCVGCMSAALFRREW